MVDVAHGDLRNQTIMKNEHQMAASYDAVRNVECELVFAFLKRVSVGNPHCTVV
jgi:hypothetical protein